MQIWLSTSSVRQTITNNVKEIMKAENKIYHVKQDEEEVRINDYNPLILLLWKANVDIQFFSESSLARPITLVVM